MRSRAPIDRIMWTVEDLESLPDDGNRYEVLHGELLVTPLPSNRHQGVAVRLAMILGNWCDQYSGWTVRAPGAVRISQTTSLEPDVVVYPISEFAECDWPEMPVPLLVVEVFSQSTIRRDRHRKRPAYLEHGVAEVWLIDGPARLIERWTSASEFPEVFHGSITWAPDPKYPALVIEEARLFGPAPAVDT